MANRDLILKLARVIIAVAWADGEITNEEINSLKELIFSLRRSGFDEVMQFSAQEWARLDMYIETPVSDLERQRLVADLQNSLRTQADKQLALRSLKRIVEADGIIVESEEEVLTEISQAVKEVEVGLLGGVQRIVGNAIQRRLDVVAGAPNREAYFDDYIRNKVYYRVKERLKAEGIPMSIDGPELKQLGLIGGLMAKVAHLDREISKTEFDRIVQLIQEHGKISFEEATFVSEVAITSVDATFDTFRMVKEFSTNASLEQRRRVLRTLFAVAHSDGKISVDELEEIRVVARGLKLTHKDFIDAKLIVLGMERPGS